MRLPGVGRKTANVVLGNAFRQNVGVVVDTHVARLSARLGLTRHTDPKKIEPVLMKLVPQKDWTLFSHWLIFHGRRRCKALSPIAPGCELKDLCPSYPRIMKLVTADLRATASRKRLVKNRSSWTIPGGETAAGKKSF